MEIIRDNLNLCLDCHSYASSGVEWRDVKAFYMRPQHSEEEIERAIEKVEKAVGNGGLGLTYTGEENDIEFSFSRCDCCGSRLGGARYKYLVLG